MDTNTTTDAAAPPLLDSHSAEAASQTVLHDPAAVEVTLTPHICKDGTVIAQDMINIQRDGEQIRVGYAGHGPKGGIALIRKVTPEEKLAIELAVGRKHESWLGKTVECPELEGLVGDSVAAEEEREEVFEED